MARFAFRRLLLMLPMVLIACELNGVNPFDYLIELQRHAEELKQTLSEWMPWNYRETLARLATPHSRVI